MSLTVPFNPYEQGDTFDPARVSWVFNDSDLDRLLSAVETASEVVVDLETTGLDEHATRESPGGVSARVVLASFTLPQVDAPYDPQPTTWVLPLSHPDSPFTTRWRKVLGDVAGVMEFSGVPVVNHNMKFDARWIYAATGVDLSGLIEWDTQISSHLLDETTSTALKERVPAVLGVDRWDDFDLKTPGAAERVPVMDLGLYAARDTYWTWRLYRLHRAEMFAGSGEGEPETPEERESARLGKFAAWVAMPTTRTLTAIEQRGIGVDLDWVADQIAEEEQRRAGELDVLLGRGYQIEGDLDVSFAPTSRFFAAWSEAAVAEGALAVTSMTKTGKPQWSKSVLTRQARAGSEVAQTLLDYRRAVKRLEYLRSWVEATTPDGRLHATYHAGRVLTGRLSASDPNMQQVTKALKPAFVPRPGYLIAELDYSQIELRTAAFVSRCRAMIDAFRRGDDLHNLFGATLTGKAPADVLPEERQAAKSANFGLLYMMGPGGFREYAEDVYGVQFTEAEAEDVHRAWFDQWDGMRDWHERTVARAHREGQVVSPLGRVRRLPNLYTANEYLRTSAERQAVNAPVQSFASDLMQIAAASIEGTLPGSEPLRDVYLVGTVHDSIVAEVPADDWKRATARAMRRMLDLDEVLARLDCVLDVPLAVEASVGTRWGLADVGIVT